MEWVYDRHIITENVSQALDWGVRAGHYDVAQWFVKRFSDEQWPLWSILTSTACGGSLKAWQLLRNGETGGIDVSRYCLNLAATYGHLELVQFLANEHGGVLISGDVHRGSLLEAAVTSGNLELVKRCVELSVSGRGRLVRFRKLPYMGISLSSSTKGLQRASGAGNNLVHHIDLSAIDVVQMLESGDRAPLIEWISLHVPKEEEIGYVELFMSYHQSSQPSWELMRRDAVSTGFVLSYRATFNMGNSTRYSS